MIGPDERVEYGVVGEPVNLASRIDALTKDVEATVLVSKEVAMRLGPEFVLGRATVLPVKGNYVCLPSGTGFKFTLFTPEATPFNENGKQIITHYFSPNPDEAGKVVRATWQSRDTSTVWGSVGPDDSSSDPAFVKPGAIAWLKVTVVGNEEGPSGGDRLTETTFIQRLNTNGGLAPSTGCTSLSDVGHEEFVPYTADYFFYKEKDKDR